MAVRRLAEAEWDEWAARGQRRERPDALTVADVQPEAVGRVLAAMRGPLDRPLPLSALAEIAGLSPFHFARVFRQVTGSPPGQFLAALRMERAKELLLSTDLPVTEVCFAVGYDSLGTFTTRFAQLVGMPPTRLRRLPDELAEAVARVPEDGLLPAPRGPAGPGQGVEGWVAAAEVTDALIFVGLFPGVIPQGRPLVGTVLTAPGPFQLPASPDGDYHLLAAAVPHPRDVLACLMPGPDLRVGRAEGTVQVRAGRAAGPADIRLRPPLPTDPPVLVALPGLLLDSCPQFQRGRRART